MAQAHFPEPKDLVVPFHDMIGDGTNIFMGKWDVSNPHPGYGKDPNILNEYGHTKYPMYVGDVVVNNEEEEAEERAKTAPSEAPAKTGW